MRSKTRKAMRTGRKNRLTREVLESLVEELLDCGSKRKARWFGRYLMAGFSDRFKEAGNSRSKESDQLLALAEELDRRKTMTGKEVIQFWLRINKGNRATRLLDTREKAEEAADKEAAAKLAGAEAVRHPVQALMDHYDSENLAKKS